MNIEEITIRLVLSAVSNDVSKGKAINEKNLIAHVKPAKYLARVLYDSIHGTDNPAQSDVAGTGEQPVQTGKVGILSDRPAKATKGGGFAAPKPASPR